MGKIKDKINALITGIAYGSKNAEDAIFTQLGSSHTENFTINQEARTGRVSQDLLKGELTQEVKELRYRTYKVDRESNYYEYFSPTLAKKHKKIETKFVKYEDSERLNLITIQENKQNIGTVKDGLESAECSEDGTMIFKEPKKEYLIKIERHFVPRYRIEEFLDRVVIFSYDKDGYNSKVDFYVSKYTDDKKYLSKGFVREIENVRDKQIRSDVLDFDSLSFITSNAYGMDDLVKFEISGFKFDKIIEYDGNYIIRYYANIEEKYDMMDDYYNKEMDEKYKRKEKKERTLNLTDNFSETYICEKCGKVVVYDPYKIDEMNPTKPRDVEDTDTGENTDYTEYLDMQISEQTCGKRLCKECMEKYLKEQEEINNLK